MEIEKDSNYFLTLETMINILRRSKMSVMKNSMGQKEYIKVRKSK